MYFVKYGDEYLHDPRTDDCLLVDLSLECASNSSGFCTFTIYPTNPMYNSLVERDTVKMVNVYDDELLLFSGFIYELGSGFYLDGKVSCKGELALLDCSVVRPYSTESSPYSIQAPSSANGYFEWLVDQHNNQVDDSKRFVVGINQASSLIVDNYVYAENGDYPTTWEEINDKLIDSFGGYISVRHTDGKRYIDYLSEYVDENSQILDFGVNLTDFVKTDDSLDLATFVIPVGAPMKDTEYEYDTGYYVTTDRSMNSEKEYYTYSSEYDSYSKFSGEAFEDGVTYYEYFEDLDESNNKLNISSIVDYSPTEDYMKQGDYIFCRSAVHKYGMIGVKYEDREIVTKESLIYNGILYLKELISPKRTIEIKAVDMHLANPKFKTLKIGEYVRVRSKPHEYDSYMLVTSIDLDLNKPDNSSYTLGTTFDTLTGEQNKRIKKLNASINATYESAEKISEEAKAAAKNADSAKVESVEAKAVAAEAKAAADVAIVGSVDEYAVSYDPSISPAGGWSSNSPEYSNDVFIWKRTTFTYGDGRTETADPVCITGNTGQNGEDATLLRIDSSRGTVFKNDSISTVLSVAVYKGGTRVTDIATLKSLYGNSAYIEWSWQHIDEQTFGVISVSDSRIGNDGFTFTLSPEDVDTKVTFMCELKT